MKKFWVGKGIMFFALFVLGIMAVAAIVMTLWNAILPEVTSVKAISFSQALGILVLTRLLFGRIVPGGWRGRGDRDQWKRNMQQKWANMSPEERVKFKDQWRNRKSCRPDANPETGQAGA